MRRFIFCFVFGLYLDFGCLQEQDKVCDVGDFCEYKCQCKRQCQDNLKCADNDKCKRGWFGYRCQYQDLAVFNATLTTEPPSRNVSWLTDQNDNTCNTETDLKSITVTWRDKRAIP
ncbi:uncharacterized protein LOC129926214, partial [Biomphalaria glabrata]|uniref:Uncharacterized protein LOC129926214 n=1 Tax=Biomphalaria glabrata TaxID=6526 RepID=A0A9W3ABW3_BIOGL